MTLAYYDALTARAHDPVDRSSVTASEPPSRRRRSALSDRFCELGYAPDASGARTVQQLGEADVGRAKRGDLLSRCWEAAGRVLLQWSKKGAKSELLRSMA
jgi:hypothetical protein